MVNVTIDARLASLAPEMRLGLLRLEGIEVGPSGPALWQRLLDEGALTQKRLATLEGLAACPSVEATKRTYRALGKDPARYRGSAEALARRLLQGKPLFRINNVVEINNIVSLSAMLPVGSYDLSAVQGDVVFRAGAAGESYQAIGEKALNLEGVPVFCDALGPFGSPTSDSERTMVTSAATEVLTAIIDFGGKEAPMEALLQNAGLLFEAFVPHARATSWIVG
jgi:DNA/RNA-binding domain of Phe-tRNA-synthetase-like protein